MENQKVIGILVGGIVVGAALGAGVTFNMKKRGSVGGSVAECSIGGQGLGTGALFELDGKTYTRDQLSSEARDVLFQIENQSYESASNYLKEVALRTALAREKDKNADINNLPPLKTLLGAGSISEEEMRKFFEANKGNLPPGTTFEQVRPQLEQFMAAQRVGETARTKVTELESSGRFKLALRPPAAPAVNLKLDGYPTKGAANAEMTLVEISDYLCPHCRAIKPEVEAVINEMGGKVKFVQINYALRPAGLSGALTRGGFCAQKQGGDSFWKYHDKAFQIPTEAANAVSPDEAKEFNAHAVKAATDAGINVAEFEKCLTSDEAKKAVETTNQEMNAIGVSGTPTFFLNNRKLSLSQGGLKKAVQLAAEGGKAQ